MAAKLLRFENEVHIRELDLPPNLGAESKPLDGSDIINWMAKLVVMNMEDDYHLALLDIRKSRGKTDFRLLEDYKMNRAIEGILKVISDDRGLTVRSYDTALSGQLVEQHQMQAGFSNPYQRWYSVGSTRIRVLEEDTASIVPLVAAEEIHYLGGGSQWPQTIHVSGKHTRRRLLETGDAGFNSQENYDEAADVLRRNFNKTVVIE